MIIKKLWMVNGVLGVVALMMSYKAYYIWQSDDYGIQKNKSESKEQLQPPQKFSPIQRLPETEYRKTIERNLFSPDRAEIQEKIAPPLPSGTLPAVEEVKPLETIEGKKITLFGVILLPEYRVAIINNPDDANNEHKQKKIHIGDEIGQFKLTEIKKDRVLLSKGVEKFEILLYDKDNPKERGKGREKEQGPVNSQAKDSKNVKPTIITTQNEKTVSQQKSLEKPSAAEDEFEMVETPFGMIKRRKK